MSDYQSRKYTIVINNPDNYNVNSDFILEVFAKLQVVYGCFAKEIGENGTPHYHIFIFRKTGIRFRTIKNIVPFAHIEKCLGSIRENVDYVKKEGKWLNTSKAETQIKDSFVEFGEMPSEREEKSPVYGEILEQIENGVDTIEIIQNNPKFLFKSKDIDLIKQKIRFEKYENCTRDITVEYIFGSAGTGKTSSIFKKHKFKDVCRITSKSRDLKFDSYNGQDVLVFEEFASQIPIQDMLNYLDIYPLSLPARYYDRTACYTNVYITSNLSLEEQYPDVQKSQPEVWKAFLRRIHIIKEYTAVGKYRYLKGGDKDDR